ncbi:MAG: hydrolase TatD [Chlamydia sp. 32-24]|nr:MAG: hydrolase TatD [Chlamydia sp. 32-24]
MYIDSHAHLSCETLADLVDSFAKRAKDANVAAIINICTDKKSFEKGLEIANKYPWVYNTAATPPHTIEEEGEKFFPLFKEAAKNKQIVALGEFGLDYYYEHSPKEIQKKFLVKYFHLAQEYNLPVVIHCRNAFDDFFEILDQEYKGQGVLHCFTGTLEEAKKVIDRGWYLSLSGIVTFKKSLDLQEVAKYVPLEQLLIETDSPYLAPQSKRGKQNEPSYIVEIAHFVANLKKLDSNLFNHQMKNNLKALFNLPI